MKRPKSIGPMLTLVRTVGVGAPPPPWGFSRIAKKRRRVALPGFGYLMGQTLRNFWQKKIDRVRSGHGDKFWTPVNFEVEYFLNEETDGVLTDTVIYLSDQHLTWLSQLKPNAMVG